MSIAQDLSAVLETAEQSLARLDVLAQHIPQEWIKAAAMLAGKVTIRRRRLPADMVLWLVVGMAFFHSEPITEVARRLNICVEGLANEVLLAKSTLSHARQRLGKQPIEWLFQQCAKVWRYERYPQDHWHKLQVFAADGALFRTQETAELREHFGSGNTSTARQTPYPVLRLVALINVRSHVIANAAISPYRRGEIPLASEFVASIPAHSVTLLDKGFFSAELLLGIENGATNRYWLNPARKGVVATELMRYGAGDCLVQMRVSPQARKKNPQLPEHWQARAVTYEIHGKDKTVFTSLPAEQFSAEQVATLYHERWENELGFRDIKSSMQGSALTLRSKTVDLVYQERWGLLLGYNVVRREASQAAVAHQRSPNEISFKFACQFIASQLVLMAGALSPAHTPRRLEELRGSIATLFITDRPRPSRPRTVKMFKTRYPVDRNAAPLK